MRLIANHTRHPGDPKIVRSGHSSLTPIDRTGRALGWFSIGLGVFELTAARTLARWLGLRGQAPLIRAFGARELGAGILTLSADKTTGLWSRVAGDALDIAVLATGLQPANRQRGNVGIALAMVGGITALDIFTARASLQLHGRAASPPRRSYRDRSGYPKGIEAARRLALESPSTKQSAPKRIKAAVE